MAEAPSTEEAGLMDITIAELRRIPPDLIWTEDHGDHESLPIGAFVHAAADQIERLRAALEQITRCDALNKGPVAATIARTALRTSK
jgi:hypothetical protein